METSGQFVERMLTGLHVLLSLPLDPGGRERALHTFGALRFLLFVDGGDLSCNHRCRLELALELQFDHVVPDVADRDIDLPREADAVRRLGPHRRTRHGRRQVRAIRVQGHKRARPGFARIELQRALRSFRKAVLDAPPPKEMDFLT